MLHVQSFCGCFTLQKNNFNHYWLILLLFYLVLPWMQHLMLYKEDLHVELAKISLGTLLVGLLLGVFIVLWMFGYVSYLGWWQQ